MSSRPEITLFCDDSVAIAGETLTFTVGIACLTAVAHGGISIRTVIRERREQGLTFTGLIPSREYSQRIHFEHDHSVPPRTLGVGLTSYPMALEMPARLPGAIDNGRTKIECKVEVWVDLPWAIDAKAERVIPLVASPPASLPEPVDHCSSAASSAELPVIECSCSPGYFVVGQPFECAIALTGASSDVAGIDLRLVQIEEASIAECESVVETEIHRWNVTRKAPSDGEVVPLRATIPSGVAGSFETELTRVRYELEVMVLRPFSRARKLRVPCVLLSRPMLQSERQEAVLLGLMRRDAAWQELGAQLARRGATLVSVNIEARSARFNIDGASVSITADRDRTLGPGVRVELRFDSLGIGLWIREKSLLDRGANPPSMSAEFDAASAIDLRDLGQLTEPVAKALGDAALGLARREVRDDHAQGWISGVMLTPAELERLVERVCDVARSLRVARESVRCPRSLASRRAAWLRFAERTSATLREGDLSIVGWTVRGVRCSIDWVFEDDRPTDVALRVTAVGDVEGLGAEADALSAALGRPVSVRDGLVVVSMGALDDPGSCEPVSDALVTAMLERAHVSQGSFR